MSKILFLAASSAYVFMSPFCKRKDLCEASYRFYRPVRPDRRRADPVESESGCVQHFVMEGVVPFREVQIAGDDRWPPLVVIRDDVMEIYVLPGAHGLETEVVDDEQVCLGQCRQLALEVAHGPR